MGATVVLGAQWGDEGKGKVIDSLAADADMIVRFQGGANAGHTIVIGDKRHPIHLLPSGIFREGKMNLVGSGVMFDPEVGLMETELARAFGSRVMLDPQTPIVLPMHKLLDAARERAAGLSAIGTTKRGIGPAYSDFWLRRGLTLSDMRSRVNIASALQSRGYWNELCAIGAFLEGEQIDFQKDLGLAFDPFDLEETIDWCAHLGEQLHPYLGDTRREVHRALEKDKHVLFEGAQGVMLDGYHGAGEFKTSSLCTAAGVSATFGVYAFQQVIGVAKAYVTRVGAGPFPTELHGAEGDALRQRGHEFGTTTGRPRRCGWLDLPALCYACRMGGITQLVVTKMDVLSGFPGVQYCMSYEDEVRHETLNLVALTCAKPRLLPVPFFTDQLDQYKHFSEMPEQVMAFLRTIELETKVSIVGIGVGAERSDIIWWNAHWDAQYGGSYT